MPFSRVSLTSVALVALLAAIPAVARADTLAAALSSTYNTNPTLNAQRAALRATDEGVPQALSGYRPVVTGTAGIGLASINSTAGSTSLTPRSVGLTIEQPLFRGFQTQNNVKGAESSVLAGREILRSTEQDVFLDAVGAYTNVIQSQAILQLREQNIVFLQEQVRAATDRLKVGEGTRTDLAQTEASLSQGQTDYQVAVSNLNANKATYLQVIGMPPRNLVTPVISNSMLPKSLNAAMSLGLKNHPAILTASYNVDTAAFNVKSIEGQLLPTVSLQGNLSHSDEQSQQNVWNNSASVTANLVVPLYEGGVVYSQARQAKETLGQRRIQLDGTRDQVRSAVSTSWGQLEAARAAVVSAEAGVKAAQLALDGVIEEQKVGQRTTLDVLLQQQTLIQARESLVLAQRSVIVAAYSIMSSVGSLSADKLGLKVATYKPQQHYNAVRDKWFGLRTPDGR